MPPEPKKVPVDQSRSAALTRLNAQKILALQAGNTKAAAQIEKVIQALQKKTSRTNS